MNRSVGIVSVGAICGGVIFEWRRVQFCPTENKRRRFYGSTSSLWYAAEWTCLGCGDRWSDGERGSRPFMRGWRKEAIARARERWKNAKPLSRAAFRAAVEAELT